MGEPESYFPWSKFRPRLASGALDATAPYVPFRRIEHLFCHLRPFKICQAKSSVCIRLLMARPKDRKSTCHDPYRGTCTRHLKNTRCPQSLVFLVSTQTISRTKRAEMVGWQCPQPSSSQVLIAYLSPGSSSGGNTRVNGSANPHTC